MKKHIEKEIKIGDIFIMTVDGLPHMGTYENSKADSLNETVQTIRTTLIDNFHNCTDFLIVGIFDDNPKRYSFEILHKA